MQIKESAILPALRGGLKKLDTYALAEYAARFFMALILARARLLGAISPFGVAFTAASPDGVCGLVTLLGAVIGSLTMGSFYISVKYIAAAVLVRATLHFFSERRSRYFPMAVTFAVMGVIGMVYVWEIGWELVSTAKYVVETFLSAGMVCFYTVALSPSGGTDAGRDVRALQNVSSALLIGTLLMALSDVELLGVLSIGRFAATLVIMYVVSHGGTGVGCTVAAVLGLAMDLSRGGAPFFTLSYTMTALIAGIFAREGRLIFLLTYAASDALSVLWNWQYGIGMSPLYETFAASVIFMLLPESLLARFKYLLPAEASGFGFLKAREYTRDRVELCAEAFRGIYRAVRTASGESTCENISEIFDRASDAVCRSCPNSARCWQERYIDTVDVMNNLAPIISQRGRAELTDMPEHFREICDRHEGLLAAINTEARSFLARRQYRARLSENRVAACNQYHDISALLSSLARELGSDIEVEPALELRLRRYLRGIALDASVAVFRLRGGRLRAEIRSKSLQTLRRDGQYLDKLSEVLGVRLCTTDGRQDPERLILLEAEPLSVTVGVSGARRIGESVSGDRSRYFRTDEGILYVLLSDGMGSGPEAAKISGEAVSVLERFLLAGIAPDVALRILSDLYLLKNDSDLESATVDLLSINMFTGEASIFKYGAAPSFVKKGSAVKRVTGSAPPVGFRPSPPLKSVRAGLRLPAGSIALMVSDGITAGGDDKWLRTLLSDFEGDAPELARRVLESAPDSEGLIDDATVIAVKVDTRR